MNAAIQRLRQAPGYMLALAGLALFVLGFDLWAVIVDQRLSGSDSVAPEVASIALVSRTGTLQDMYIMLMGPKGPVGIGLGYLLLLLVPDAPLGQRLIPVMAHGALVFQAFALARRLGGDRAAGLWSALICATTPMVFGWCRLDFQEGLMAAQVVGALHLMLVLRLRRIWPAALLGLFLALGVLNKASFIIFMTAPGIWFVARRVRSLRAALGLLVLVIALVAGMSPWLYQMIDMDQLAAYTGTAAATGGLLDVFLANAEVYLSMPGVTPLLVAAALSAAALLAWGGLDRRDLVLPVSCLVVSLVAFFGFVNLWSRYIVPVLPVAAVLAGLGLGRGLQLLPGLLGRLGLPAGVTVTRAAGGLLAGSLVLMFVWLNLVGAEPASRAAWAIREEAGGMITPDTRAHLGFPRAAHLLQGRKQTIQVLFDSHEIVNTSRGIISTWAYRSGLDLTTFSVPEVQKLLGRGVTVPVVRIAHRLPSHDNDGMTPVLSPLLLPLIHAPKTDESRWMAAQPGVEELSTSIDPDGRAYTAILLRP